MAHIQHFLSELPPLLAYTLLFFTTLTENLFPPFPGDSITLIGAYMVGIGTLNYWDTYLVTTAGSLAGFLILYLVGLRFGRSYFYRKDFKYFSRRSINEVEGLFQRRGILIIALNRFFSGIRAIISLVAGIAEYDWRVVTGLGFVSCVLWNGVLIYAGSRVGENWKKVMEWVRQYNLLVFFLLGIILAIWGYFHLYLPVRNARNHNNNHDKNS